MSRQIRQTFSKDSALNQSKYKIAKSHDGQSTVRLRDSKIRSRIHAILENTKNLGDLPVITIGVIGVDEHGSRNRITTWLNQYYKLNDPYSDRQFDTTDLDKEFKVGEFAADENQVYAWTHFVRLDRQNNGTPVENSMSILWVLYVDQNADNVFQKFVALASSKLIMFDEQDAKRCREYFKSTKCTDRLQRTNFANIEKEAIAQLFQTKKEQAETLSIRRLEKKPLTPVVDMCGKSVTISTLGGFLESICTLLNVPHVNIISPEYQETECEVKHCTALINDLDRFITSALKRDKDSKNILAEIVKEVYSTYRNADKHFIIKELQDICKLVDRFSFEVLNAYDHYVCFSGDDLSKLKEIESVAVANVKQRLIDKNHVHSEFTANVLSRCIDREVFLIEEHNSIIVRREQILCQNLSSKLLEVYGNKIRVYSKQNPTRQDIPEMMGKLKVHCLRILSQALNSNGKLNNVATQAVLELDAKMSKSIKDSQSRIQIAPKSSTASKFPRENLVRRQKLSIKGKEKEGLNQQRDNLLNMSSYIRERLQEGQVLLPKITYDNVIKSCENAEFVAKEPSFVDADIQKEIVEMNRIMYHYGFRESRQPKKPSYGLSCVVS